MKFYLCQRCGYVKTAVSYETSNIPYYCPRCRLDTYWRGPLDDKKYTLSGNRYKKAVEEAKP
jgi:late competence protein required for DNA uptake (superfamily II DNA/RNA helicase)